MSSHIYKLYAVVGCMSKADVVIAPVIQRACWFIWVDTCGSKCV